MLKKLVGIMTVLIMALVVGCITASAADKVCVLHNDNIVVTDNAELLEDSIDGIVVGYIGDSDVNDVVNIKDATNIQKYVAEIVPFTSKAIALSDADGNGSINVKDATTIQKYIAGISVRSDINRLMYIEGEHTHSYMENIIAPTCTSGGYTLHSCICGDEYQEAETPIKQHNNKIVVTEATCTSQGYTTYTCVDCGFSFKVNYVSPQGHAYASKVTAATCTSQGYTTYTCSVCKDSYVGNYTDRADHKYTSKVTKPTCSKGGYTDYTCSVCGYHYVGNKVGATNEHSFEDYECTLCGITPFDYYTSWIVANGVVEDEYYEYSFDSIYDIDGLENYEAYVDYYPDQHKISLWIFDSKYEELTLITLYENEAEAYCIYGNLDDDYCIYTYIDITTFYDGTSVYPTEDSWYDSYNQVNWAKDSICLTIATHGYGMEQEVKGVTLTDLGFYNFLVGEEYPKENSKTVAFDRISSWMIDNGNLTSDGESYVFYDSNIAVSQTTRVGLFYNFYDEEIEIYWTDDSTKWSAWVTITRDWSYADYVLMCDDYLTASGSFAMSTMTSETSYLSYDYIYNPDGISALSVRESCALAVKYALTSYEKYDFYYDMPASLYELGFTNYS